MISSMTKVSHMPSLNLKETLISGASSHNDNFEDSLFEDLYDPNNLEQLNENQVMP